MLKKIVCLGLILAVGITFMACNNNEDLKKRIDVLQTQLQEQANKIAELEKENQAAISALTKKMEIERGVFYNRLELAYEKQLLTKEDLMHISYFRSGEVLEVKEGTGDRWLNELNLPASEWTVIKKVNFVPKIAEPELDTIEQDSIRLAFYLNHREKFFNATPIEEIKISGYWGKYNRNYVVEIEVKGWDVDTGIHISCVGGIIFYEDSFFNVLST